MVLVVEESITEDCITLLNQLGENAWKLGQVIEKTTDDSVTFK